MRRGARKGPAERWCTDLSVERPEASTYHSSFGCDSTPDLEEAGQRIAEVVVAIVGGVG